MTRIFALTEPGLSLARRISRELPDAEICFKPKPFTEAVQQAFKKGERLILICAMGIAVRTLAPVLQSKLADPPVLVMDEYGHFVIPLLSGHEGGANHWGYEIAQQLGAELVLTGARQYLSPRYTVGMGCERNCPEADLDHLLQSCLALAGLTVEQISSINSIDIKADEPGLIALAERWNTPFQTWDAETLLRMNSLLSTRSQYVFDTVGVYGVAESAALWAATRLTEHPPELILTKQKNSRATCAIARSYLDGPGPMRKEV